MNSTQRTTLKQAVANVSARAPFLTRCANTLLFYKGCTTQDIVQSRCSYQALVERQPNNEAAKLVVLMADIALRHEIRV
jgi:hypothetical protein